MSSVAVVGSINLDVVVTCERFPAPGQTVAGSTVSFGPGGKGANQALAAARAGAEVTFIGAVGTDDGAETVAAALREAGVGLRITAVPGPTGVAVVTVDDAGENVIVVVPGANAALRLTDEDRAVIARAEVLLVQLEIPTPVVLDAVRAARAAGTAVLLNPSPVRELPPQLWASVDAVVVNESEAHALGAHLGAVRTVVTTLGGDGARLSQTGQTVRAAGVPVDVVDTTGAGDAFTGTLAASWHLPLVERIRRANVAGALATTTAGAAAAPTAAQVDAALERGV